MRGIFGLIFAAVAIFMITSACASADWPVFRQNPARTGYTDITGDLGPDYVVSWTYTVPGSAFGSPAVADLNGDNRLEIAVPTEGGAEGREKNLFVLDSTGKLLWDFATDGGISSSPAIADLDSDGKREVVFGTNRGEVYAIDGMTGTEVWSMHKPNSAFRSSPLVYDVDGDGNAEVVIGSIEGTLYCIDGNSGATKWTYQTDDEISSSPSVIGSDIVFGSADGFVYSLDSRGVLDWKLEVGSPVIYSTPAAMPLGGFAIGTDNGRMLIIENGKLSYSFYANSSISGSPAVGVSGNKTIVVFGTAIEEDVHGVYVPQTKNKIYCMNQNGALLWSLDTGGWSVFSSPALADIDRDDRLEAVIGTRDGRLYVIDAETGRKEWDFFDGTGIYASPAVADVDGDGDAEIVVAYRFSNQVKLLDSPEKPDLTIESLSVSDEFPENGKVVDITVVVENHGQVAAKLIIGFYRRSPLLDTAIGNLTLTEIAPGESASATLSWNVAMPPGEMGIYAVADPEDLIDEADERNNGAYRGFYNNLYITGSKFPEEIKQATSEIGTSLQVTVFNKGRLDLVGVEGALLLRRPNSTVELSRKSMDISANSQAVFDLSFKYTPVKNGSQTIVFIVDPGNKTVEISESDNSVEWEMGVPQATVAEAAEDKVEEGQGANPIILFILILAVVCILWEKALKPKLEKKRAKKKTTKDKEAVSNVEQTTEGQSSYADTWGGYSSDLPNTLGQSGPDKPVE